MDSPRHASTSPPPASGSIAVDRPESCSRGTVAAPGEASTAAHHAELLGAVSALEGQLVACQKLAMIGSLTAVIAHEFNNLMTPLVASAELAISSDDPELMKKTLTRGMNQAQRAIELSRRLLDLADARSEPPAAVRLADAVQAALDTAIRPGKQETMLLRVVVPTELHVRAHRDLLVQLLMNLILNGHKACEGGRASLTISARRTDGEVEIDVCDSGKGLPKEYVDRVLNPFLAADPAATPCDWMGVGLGLCACRIIARKQNARLHFIVNDSGGCTVRVHWPVAEGR